MQLGVIGLGRMGANIVRRLQRHGHACVVYDAQAGGSRASWPRKGPPGPPTWKIWWPSSNRRAQSG